MLRKGVSLSILILISITANAFADSAAINSKAKAVGKSNLGSAQGAAKELPGGGWVRRYSRGAIYSTSDTGTHAIYGAAYRRYKALGAEKSALGAPVTDGGSEVILQHGAIDVSKSGKVTVRNLRSVTFTTTTATLNDGNVRMASNTDALFLPQSGAGGDTTTITCSCKTAQRPGTGSCDVTLSGNTVTCSQGSCSGGCQITIVK